MDFFENEKNGRQGTGAPLQAAWAPHRAVSQRPGSQVYEHAVIDIPESTTKKTDMIDPGFWMNLRCSIFSK